MYLAIHPFRDVDVYWHVLLGKEIVEAGSVSGAGSDWSFGLPDVDWTTTQWLSEVVFYGLQDAFGWEGIAAFQFTVALVLVMGLARLLLRGHPSPWAPVIYVLTLVPLVGSLQERPALFSMLFALWLASVARDVLVGAAGLRLWIVLVLTAAWANLHGLWVLVPFVFGLLTLGRLAECGHRASRTLMAQTAVAVAAGCLTPVGWSLLSSPFRLSAATRDINEWQATSFDNPMSFCLGLLMLGIVLAWGRSAERVPASELIYVVGIVAFGLFAFRNLSPAALLLAPVVVRRLAVAFPRRDAADSAAERKILALVGVAAIALTSLALWAKAATTPTLPSEVPVRLIETLAQQPGDHRVLNDYNLSGAVLFWGGPRTTVAVDGRADRYGANYIRRHLELTGLGGQWRETLERSTANYALFKLDAPLVVELERRQWTRLSADDHHVLLRAPKRGGGSN